jgi:hypothetical protein
VAARNATIVNRMLKPFTLRRTQSIRPDSAAAPLQKWPHGVFYTMPRATPR